MLDLIDAIIARPSAFTPQMVESAKAAKEYAKRSGAEAEAKAKRAEIARTGGY